MPVELNQIEPDIFLMRYDGNVTLEEIRQSHKQSLAIALKQGIPAYVHILLLTDVRIHPMNPTDLFNIIRDHPRNIAVLLVDVPVVASVLARAVDSIMRDKFIESFTTVEDATQRARQIIKLKPVD